jgi:hypothetical protein
VSKFSRVKYSPLKRSRLQNSRPKRNPQPHSLLRAVLRAGAAVVVVGADAVAADASRRLLKLLPPLP